MMNRRLALSLLAVLPMALTAASPALGQEQSPESLGLSSERLEWVAELMQRRIDERTFSGAVTLIARDDRVAYFRAHGLMDLASARLMQRDTVFRIMSMTKPVVALSILMMIEDGKVRLTDPVSRFIPELKELDVAGAADGQAPQRTVEAEREVTIGALPTIPPV